MRLLMCSFIINLLILAVIATIAPLDVKAEEFDSSISEAETFEEYVPKLRSVLTIELGYLSGQATNDVINMFAHHLKYKSKYFDRYRGELQFRFLPWVGFLGSYAQTVFVMEETNAYDLEEEVLEISEIVAGLRFVYDDFNLDLQYGEVNTFTFLETDTNFYFIHALDLAYYRLAVGYRMEIFLGFAAEVFLINDLFESAEQEQFEVVEGYERTWGGNVIYGRKYQLGLGFKQSHRNIKIIHGFYGLRNEMNNKSEETVGHVFLRSNF